MRLTYCVTGNDYKAAIRYQNICRLRSPKGAFTAILLTIGQLILIASLCLKDGKLSRAEMFVLCLSVIVFGMNSMLYLPTGLKTKMIYQRILRSGQWSEEAARRTFLTADEDYLEYHCGKVRRRLAAVSVSRVVRYRENWMILTGDIVFAVIPEGAFRNEEQRREFMRELRRAKYRESIRMGEELRAELARREGPPVAYHYSCTLDSYLDLQCQAWQNSHGKTGALGKEGPSWLRRSLTSGIRDLISFEPDTGVDLFYTEDALVILGDIHSLRVPWDDVKDTAPLKGGAVFYLKDRVRLTVPRGGTGDQRVCRHMGWPDGAAGGPAE